MLKCLPRLPAGLLLVVIIYSLALSWHGWLLFSQFCISFFRRFSFDRLLLSPVSALLPAGCFVLECRDFYLCVHCFLSLRTLDRGSGCFSTVSALPFTSGSEARYFLGVDVVDRFLAFRVGSVPGRHHLALCWSYEGVAGTPWTTGF